MRVVFRDPLSILTRPSAAPVAMTAPEFRAPQLPLWPSGVARCDDGILEITLGGGLRVATCDVLRLDVAPALGARLLLTLAYRDGFDTIERKYWVAVADHDRVQRLVAEVRAASAMRAC
jgi:hypothetical protein